MNFLKNELLHLEDNKIIHVFVPKKLLLMANNIVSGDKKKIVLQLII